MSDESSDTSDVKPPPDSPNQELGQAELYLTERDKECAVYKGFRFYFHKRLANGLKRWKCIKYQAPTYCRSKLLTDQSGTVYSIGEHIGRDGTLHHSMANIGLKLMLRNNLKAKAATSSLNPAKIIDETIQQLGATADQVMPYIPSRESLSRIISRQRLKVNGPRTTEKGSEETSKLSELIIPEELQVTTSGENFILYDSGPEDEERWLILGTAAGLATLSNCRAWFIDGSFRPIPSIFSQLLTLYALEGHENRPQLYILIPSSSEAMYTKLFYKFKSLLGEYNPAAIFADYDTTLLCALQAVFPYPCRHLGAYNHFKRSLLRDITANGVHTQYNQDVDVQMKIKKLAALSFLRPDLVEETFNRLSLQFSPDMDGHLVHFEETWIGCSSFRGRKQATFPIPLWNFYSILLDQLPMNNEYIEGWHKKLQRRLAKKTQNQLFPFLKALIEDEAAGGLKMIKAKKSLLEKIIEIMNRFDIGAMNMGDFETVDRYLTQVAALMLNVDA